MESELYGLRDELEVVEASGGMGFSLALYDLGVGPDRARDRMASILAGGRQQPQGVLMLGVAGAVEPGMETGDLVLAPKYLPDRDGGRDGAIAPDAQMLELAENAAANERMPADRRDSLTVDHLIAEGWEREQLREKYGVASVNMEDHGVATAAAAAGVPFLSVRVILDTSGQRLPGYLPRLSRGRHSILTEVILRPWRIPAMRGLKAQMELCQSVLARFGMSYLKLEAERRRSEREKASSEIIY